MSNRFSAFIKKRVVGKNQNLVSLDEPFVVMERLLKGHRITGILDAGASNGSVSRWLLEHFPEATAYGFEPNPMYVEKLTEYASEEPRFKPQYFALSDREGTADLHVTESPGITSLFSRAKSLEAYDAKGSTVKRVEKVKVVTIDRWAADANRDIQVMKFDIQGGELKALQGATHTLQHSTLLIFIEIWFNPSYEDGAIFGDVDLFLRRNGFVLQDIYKPKYQPNGLLYWANAIYVQPQKLGLS